MYTKELKGSIFISGNNPSVSFSELFYFLKESDDLKELTPELFEYTKALPDEADNVIRALGGTVKIAEKICFSAPGRSALVETCREVLRPKGGKFNFGISAYGEMPDKSMNIGLAIKALLKNDGFSCRLVTSREKTLSSVVVSQNKLDKDGTELILIRLQDKILIAKTLAVQPFKELSRRDYGRPARDDRSGMIPPKLALAMINLAGVRKSGALYDPFCGSGTILMEAMLLGLKSVFGSDASPRAVDDSRSNLEWAIKNLGPQESRIEIFQADAAAKAKRLKNAEIDVIVTEPFLGPQRGQINIPQVVDKLNALYSKTLHALKNVLSPGGRIVMVWPILVGSKGETSINPNINGYRVLPPLPDSASAKLKNQLSFRGNLLYFRPGQKIKREIVILKKIR